MLVQLAGPARAGSSFGGLGEDTVAPLVSGDGSTVVGTADLGSGFPEVFRWTAASSSLAGLGRVAGEHAARATGVSADGSTIVGVLSSADGGFTSHFRWTAADGLEEIGLPNLSFENYVHVSGDGSTVIGKAIDP